jgi:outer membrane protein assembly factor BamB
MFNKVHSSYNARATTITTTNASTLTAAYAWSPDVPPGGTPNPKLLASPTVVYGRIYIGSNAGDFYSVYDQTGTTRWKQTTGHLQNISCSSSWPVGIESTATVSSDPGGTGLTAYVAAADGYVYAFHAATGSLLWKSRVYTPSSTTNDYFNFASPLVVAGLVYQGISADCDAPLVQGGLVAFDQATGQQVAIYHTVPDGAIGGSIWSSPAALKVTSGWKIFVTTGNAGNNQPPGDSVSIVRLNGSTLAKEGSWTVPVAEQTFDSDFGASPTLFKATLNGTSFNMIGACNKNGKFYALKAMRLSDGPVWSRQVGTPSDAGNGACLNGAIWDGSHLFVAGPQTVIGGVTYPGSIRELDPATGNVIWETGLSGGSVMGSPTMDGAGVIAVATRGGVSLVDAANGQILNTLPGGGFPQPVFADGFLFVAGGTELTAYRPSP